MVTGHDQLEGALHKATHDFSGNTTGRTKCDTQEHQMAEYNALHKLVFFVPCLSSQGVYFWMYCSPSALEPPHVASRKARAWAGHSGSTGMSWQRGHLQDANKREDPEEGERKRARHPPKKRQDAKHSREVDSTASTMRTSLVLYDVNAR
eukprot:1462753-Amphidinium_carterae.1